MDTFTFQNDGAKQSICTSISHMHLSLLHTHARVAKGLWLSERCLLRCE